MKIFNIVIIISTLCCNIYAYNNKNEASYTIYKGLIQSEIQYYERIDVERNISNDLIELSKKINASIIEGDNTLLISLTEKSNKIVIWNEYNDTGKNTDVTDMFKRDIKDKNSRIYKFFFSEVKGVVSVRNYLQTSNIVWKVLYFKRLDQYEVWMNIPDHLIIDLDYFHYVYKRVNGEYVLTGF